MKHFEVPAGYRSTLISAIKNKRKEEDKLKKDFSYCEARRELKSSHAFFFISMKTLVLAKQELKT